MHVAAKISMVGRQQGGKAIIENNQKYENRIVMDKYTISPIGTIKTPYRLKKKAPCQAANSCGAEATIEIFGKYMQGLEGLEGYEYIIILFYFDRICGHSLTARPPGAKRPRGVFATRSPNRPNHIGMTVSRLLGVEGNKIKVRDIDLLDGTPIIDIKPYIRDLDKR